MAADPAVSTKAMLRWAAWGCCGLLMLLFATLPISVQTQGVLGFIVLAGLLVLGRLPRSAGTRYLFLTLGSVVLLRYLYWRLTNTLPPLSDPVGLGFGLILLGAELFCAFVLAISLVINADPLSRPGLPRDDDDRLPTVDVFIPTYNEDETILAMTVAAAKGMDYPAAKLTVWLLDDGGTDQKCTDKDEAKAAAARQRRAKLQALSRELGAVYLTRARNEHAKAGNLNNGLEHSHGEIVVVFDADHAPFRQFLRETVGHFARDPKLFLVQTPHVFLNPDPIEKNLRTFERMPSENEMFYGVTQRGLDKWNGSFFCGSAALLRRTALQTTRGFSGLTITEDCETAFELHAQGWSSLYVDKPLIAGLQPETFTSFIGQRSRWCQGMFQILMLKNPALRTGLNPIQRLAYLSSMTFWFFPIPRLIFMVAPLLYIFLDVKIFVASIDETIAYTAAYVGVNMLMQSYLYGHVRWPWVSELYEYVQGVFLAKAIASVVASPRKPAFNVTAKGLSLETDHLSELAWPFFAVFAVLLAGVGVAAARYLFEPGVTALMFVVGLWTTFNLVIAGAALGAVAERRQIDRNPRLGIDRQGTLTLAGRSRPVVIGDVSAGGCAVRFDAAPDEVAGIGHGASGLLSIDPCEGNAAEPPVPVTLSHMTRTAATLRCGLAFGRLPLHHYRAIAELMYGDAGAIQRFVAGRRKPIGLVKGSLQFLKWSVTEPFRALSYATHRKPETVSDAVVAEAGPEIAAAPAFDPQAFAAAVLGLSAPAAQARQAMDAQAWRDAIARMNEPGAAAAGKAA